MATSVLRREHPGFFVLGFAARLPLAPLATLVYIAAATGSFTFAGIAGAAQGIANAVGGPVAGLLADRFGHARVGAAMAVSNAAALSAMILVPHADRATILAAAALAGLTQPIVAAQVRVHWSRALRGSDALPKAYAYETVADETSWVLGPFLVGVIGLIAPAAPVAAAALLLLAATLPFALRYGPPAISLQARRAVAAAPLPWRGIAALVMAMAALGAVFGAAQTGVTAYAQEIGQPGAAGLIYALLGIGSAAAGAACGLLPSSFPLRRRYLVFAAAMSAGSLPMLVLPVPVAVAILSVTIAPYMISLYAMTERLAPPDRAGLALALLCAGGPTGTAAGRAVAGVLADAHGSAGALVVLPIAAGAALVLALSGARA